MAVKSRRRIGLSNSRTINVPMLKPNEQHYVPPDLSYSSKSMDPSFVPSGDPQPLEKSKPIRNIKFRDIKLQLPQDPDSEMSTSPIFSVSQENTSRLSSVIVSDNIQVVGSIPKIYIPDVKFGSISAKERMGLSTSGAIEMTTISSNDRQHVPPDTSQSADLITADDRPLFDPPPQQQPRLPQSSAPKSAEKMMPRLSSSLPDAEPGAVSPQKVPKEADCRHSELTFAQSSSDSSPSDRSSDAESSSDDEDRPKPKAVQPIPPRPQVPPQLPPPPAPKSTKEGLEAQSPQAIPRRPLLAPTALPTLRPSPPDPKSNLPQFDYSDL